MENKKVKKVKVSLILLILSILILIGACVYFIILKDKNNTYDRELASLKSSINKAKDKLSSDEDAKEEQNKKLEQLKVELKENVEELEVWKEIKKKLEDALS